MLEDPSQFTLWVQGIARWKPGTVGPAEWQKVICRVEWWGHRREGGDICPPKASEQSCSLAPASCQGLEGDSEKQGQKLLCRLLNLLKLFHQTKC